MPGELFLCSSGVTEPEKCDSTGTLPPGCERPSAPKARLCVILAESCWREPPSHSLPPNAITP